MRGAPPAYPARWGRLKVSHSPGDRHPRLGLTVPLTAAELGGPFTTFDRGGDEERMLGERVVYARSARAAANSSLIREAARTSGRLGGPLRLRLGRRRPTWPRSGGAPPDLLVGTGVLSTAGRAISRPACGSFPHSAASTFTCVSSPCSFSDSCRDRLRIWSARPFAASSRPPLQVHPAVLFVRYPERRINRLSVVNGSMIRRS